MGKLIVIDLKGGFRYSNGSILHPKLRHSIRNYSPVEFRSDDVSQTVINELIE